MIVLTGKYSFAKIFLPGDFEDKLVHEAVDDADEHIYEKTFDFLDKATEKQIVGFLNHPGFRGRKICVMPDTHFGKGSCVGFTMDLGDIVIPNMIGVDIGCGMRSVQLPPMDLGENDLKALDNFCRTIPIGFKVHEKQVWNPSRDLAMLIGETADRVETDRERVFKSLGTLGGGNHFIELGRDSDGYIWLTIHSGSRNFGLQVAKFYQSLADKLCQSFYVDYGDLNFIPKENDLYYWYLSDMEVARMYAEENRRAMSTTIVEDFFQKEPLQVIDSVHNYIDPIDNIIRKGATSAHAGQKLVIPFNMEDGLIIATGKGNPDWNNSAPHGAGRILSRGQAKKLLDLEQTKRGMEEAGVFTTSLSMDTLDEAKGAYKSMDLILEMIQDTVTIDTLVKPLYNLKAGEKTD